MGPRDTWDRLATWLRNLGGSVGSVPKAVVVISGHWEETEFTVTSNASPPLLYDYYGFPEHTYKLKYEAPGAPALAERIRELLGQAGTASGSDPDRDFDHGVFIPFQLIYPNADIPIVQLSLKAGLDPAVHLAAGRAIESLREEGVLVAGSGMSYHNLNGFFSGAGERADQFDAWLKVAATVAAGAAGEDVGVQVYSERRDALGVPVWKVNIDCFVQIRHNGYNRYAHSPKRPAGILLHHGNRSKKRVWTNPRNRS